MNCLFCSIVEGTIPSYTIYEDDVVKAFLDINPDSNGHTLIVPKKHFLDLFDMDNETAMHILDVARLLSKKVEKKLGADGVTFIQNNGCAQDVKHFHLHLKPSYIKAQEKLSVDDVFQKLKED